MNSNIKKEPNLKRADFFYRLLRPIVYPVINIWYRSKSEPLPEIEGNYLIISNHNTNVDMIVVAASCRRPMRFVGSEHIFQKGWAARLLMWAVAPIIRQKGGLASTTVMSITRALRRGENICIFAEGNRSYDGRTCHVLPSTGKLAKAGGAALVTYRLERAYLTSPRWAYSLRRGGMVGRAVNVYTKEKLAEMTAEQVYEAICRDIYEDTFEVQEKEPRPFKGKRLAEGLEHTLYFCPECQKAGGLATKDDKLFCSCGMKATYDQYGLLNGTKFARTTDWNDWQRKKLGEYLDNGGTEIGDANVSLYKITPDHRTEHIYSGPVTLAGGRMDFGEYSFPLEELDGVGLCGKAKMVLMYAGDHYELRSTERINALKYVHAYEYITGKQVI